MNRIKQLAKNSIILIVTKLLSQATNLLLLPVYTGILSTDEYGIIDLITTIILIGIPLLSFQIEMGMFRFFITSEDNDQEIKVVTTSFGLLCINVLVFSSIFIMVQCFGHFKYGVYSWLLIIIEAYNMFALQLCRAEGDNFGYGLCSTLIVIIKAGCCVIFIVVFKLAIMGYLYSSFIAQLFGIIVLAYKSHIYKFIKKKSFDIKLLVKLLKYSIPLVFNQIASWIINFSDRIIIVSCLGLGANGIYSAASKLSNIINGVLAMFNLAWTENVTRNIKNNENYDYISNAINVFMRLLLLVVVIIIGVLSCAFDLLIGKNYFEAYNHVPILLFAMGCSAVSAFLGSVYTAYGMTAEIAVTTMMTAVINILINVCFVMRIGIYAASISTLIAFFVLAVLRYCKLLKRQLICVQTDGMIGPLLLCFISWGLYCMRKKIVCICVALVSVFLLVKMVTDKCKFTR